MPLPKYEMPDNWEGCAYKYEVQWPADRGEINSAFGARRYAYNWALSQVKQDLDQRKQNPSYRWVFPWDAIGMRRWFNRVKEVEAPWWRENSKEAYASGFADLAKALDMWRKSKLGVRKGKRVGFPRYKKRGRDRNRVRYSTGTLRVERDHRSVVLPRLGVLRSKENTRGLESAVRRGRAKIQSATLKQDGDRLFVIFSCIRVQRRLAPAPAGSKVGVDLGFRTLATCADMSDLVWEIANPRPLRAALCELRRVQRRISRCTPGSNGYRAAKIKRSCIQRRLVCIREGVTHQLTRYLVDNYQIVQVEDLDLDAMMKSLSRAFRRGCADAGLGRVRRQLGYKYRQCETRVVVVDRWFASSQVHHGCGCLLGRSMDKWLVCQVSGLLVDRDVNAAFNLRDWVAV